jgi:hypothetical protein
MSLEKISAKKHKSKGAKPKKPESTQGRWGGWE